MQIRINYLLKFGEKDNIEKLLNHGEIYMNTIDWFKNFEKDGIGDIYEGVIEVENLPNAHLTLQLPNKPIILNNVQLQIRKYNKGHIGNIYSTYAISSLLLKHKETHRIDPRMRKFGSYCLIIKDVPKFLNSISTKLTNMGIEFTQNIISYKNFKKDNPEISLFNKTHSLSYQKEYRIIVWSNVSEVLKFEIGSIKNYAEIITTETAIKSLKVERQYK